jgi:hypothetical protein
VLSEPPTLPGLYDRAEVLASNPHFPRLREAFETGTVSRPSSVTGKKYQAVTDAYIRAVHSVLTGMRSAPAAAAALEHELARITNFRTRPPQATQHRPEQKSGQHGEVEAPQ